MDLKMFVLVLLVCGVFGFDEEGLTWGDALVDDVSEFRQVVVGNGTFTAAQLLAALALLTLGTLLALTAPLIYYLLSQDQGDQEQTGYGYSSGGGGGGHGGYDKRSQDKSFKEPTSWLSKIPEMIEVAYEFYGAKQDKSR
eukprot:TRINITY_DN25410_c0_g1_i1.p1 TRINITY_DN25410_c0_g1~~TRINITY_DN25410_c0_g1_i1.p1  ORF type:complete len:151 (-),score=23.98 TRINITY_DN25410_c0_g1_i1:71-490(-)